MTIKILNEELDIKFNMAVEIGYEEIVGEPFDIESLGTRKNSLALGMSAILEANPQTKITIERLLHEANGLEIGQLNTAVLSAMSEWLTIPKVVADAEAKDPQPDVNDEQPKN